MSASKNTGTGDGKKELSASTDIRLVAARHPFKVSDRIDLVLTEGKSISQMLEIAQPDPVLRKHAVVFIDDIQIPKKNWHLVKPRGGRTVSIRIVPQGGGGGGKNPLRTILTIAVIAASFAFGAPLAGFLGVPEAGLTIAGATISASSIGGALITAIGGLLINAIAPVKPPKLNSLSGTQDRESPTLFITGSRNQASPFGVIPFVLGKHRMVPPYGANPYTEIVGNDQYLRMVFIWGYGPLKIEQVKIGETPIEDFNDIEYVHRQGFQTDGGLTLFSNDISEENFNISLPNSLGFVSRTSQDAADQLSIDIVFAQGLVEYDDQGTRQETSVTFQIEYTLFGANDWKGGGESFSSRTSAVMEAESGDKTILVPDSNGNQVATTVTADNPKRVDLVVLDRFTGEIEIITGTTAFGSEEAVVPGTPAAKIPIASVKRDTSATISASDITDLRDTVGAPFGTPATDFAPSDNATNTIDIAAGTLNPMQVTKTAKSAQAVRISQVISVPSSAQYQVRIKRVTADSTSTQVFDTGTWTILRTIRNTAPFNATGLATTELKIKATDQLNNIIDQLNGVCTSILPDWDSGSSSWKIRETQNPASHYRAILQGPANKRPLVDARLDLDGLQDWHETNTASGYQFNMVRDFPSSVWDTLTDICSSAFASPSQKDGKWGIVVDEEKSTYEQHFTPRNSWGFSFERYYPDQPHGWRMRFVNEENLYRQDERIVYDDGYDSSNATKFEELEVLGVTNPDQIWKVGRRRIAEARLRPERYKFNTDIENIICTRGDLVLLTHDAISLGLASGRIKQVYTDGGGDATSIDIDTEVEMEVGKSYGVSIRTIDNARLSQQIVTSAGTGITNLVFSTPIDSAQIPIAGDLFGFGELGYETEEVIVVGITPSTDFAATISCVPYAPAVFTADTGEIPDFVPNISVPAGTTTPFLIEIRSDEEVLKELPSGLLVPQIHLTFGRPSSLATDLVRSIEIQYREINTESYSSLIIPRRESLEVDITEVEQGITYEIRSRYITENGEGAWSALISHTVVGMATPPPDPTGLVLEGEFLRWLYTTKPKDFNGFELRTSTDTAAVWDAMTPAHDGVLDVASFLISNFPRGERIFAVKAIDIAGNYSTNSSSLIRDLGDLPVVNVVETIDLDADSFPGTIENGSIVSGDLEADEISEYLPNGSALYLTDGSASYLPSTYDQLIYITNEIFVNSDRANSRLTVDLTNITGNYVLYYRFGKDEAYLTDGAADYLPDPDAEYLPVVYQGTYKIFPAYLDVKQHDVVQFKLIGTAGATQVIVDQFNVIFDVEDEQEYFEDLVLSSGGTRLSLSKSYRRIKIVNVTLQDDGGDAKTVLIVDKDVVNGPLLQPIDSSGTGVGATVDVLVQGSKG